MKKVYILHEYGAPRHFAAVDYLKQANKIDDTIHVEFNIFKKLVKGILKLNPKEVFRSLRNLLIIIKLLFTSNQKIILGMAPYDKFIFIADFLRKKHKIYYFTSWPYWNESKYPKKNLCFQKQIIRKWNSFLKKVKIVTVTQKAMEELSNKGFSNISVIPHSVNLSIYKPLDHNSAAVNKSKINILYVGRLVEEKGLFYINKLINDLSENDFEFNIVGYGYGEKTLENIFSKGNVNFYGKIKDKNKLGKIYRNNDILILPSFRTKNWEELFGIVLIEAMASGLALISTECVGPKEIIENNINGFVVPQKNYKELKNKILVLQNDEKLLKKIKDVNIEVSKNNYSEEICSEKWLEVLKN